MITSSALLLHACARQHHERPHAADEDPRTPTNGRTDVSADEPSRLGATATVNLAPVAHVHGEGGHGVHGRATFSQTSAGVELELTIGGCARGQSYATFILAGSDCSDDALRGPHWDKARSGDITPFTCRSIADGVGRLYYTRSKSHAKPWTIGAPAASNLLGHALVIADPESLRPLACGGITRATEIGEMPGHGDVPGPDLTAVVAGICQAKGFAREARPECPDPAELTNCASRHCELDACVEKCSDYLACLAEMDDVCQAEWECEMSDACVDCRPRVTQCTVAFCLPELACAPPAKPDGPCRQLEACCARQGDAAAQCYEIVYSLEKLSGDASCQGVMTSWRANEQFAVPCTFE